MLKLAQGNYLVAILGAIYQLRHHMDFIGKSTIPEYMMTVVTRMLPNPFNPDGILCDIEQELTEELRIRKTSIKYLKNGICHEIYLNLDFAVESGASFDEIKHAVESGLGSQERTRIDRPKLIDALSEIIEERKHEKVWAKKSNKAWRRRENSKAKKIAKEGALTLLKAYCKLAQACVLSDDELKNHITGLLNRRGIKLEQKIP